MRVLILAWCLTFALLPFVAAGSSPTQVGAVPLAAAVATPEAALAIGDVDVYLGVERQGLERDACGFKSGIFIMRGEISDRRLFVTDPLNHQYYVSEQIDALSGYVTEQMTCNRSAQTGRLVVTLAGFYAGTNTSRAITLAPDYQIQEEVICEDNPACVYRP